MSKSYSTLEAEVADVQSSGSLIRLKAPVVLQWPWENGIALEHGSMRKYLEAGSKDVPLHKEVHALVMVSSEPLFFPSVTIKICTPSTEICCSCGQL